MTSRNLAIVWAPNILRSLHQDMVSEESLRDIGVQAKVVECFIDNYKELFSGRDNCAIGDNSVVRYQSMEENVGREKKSDDKYSCQLINSSLPSQPSHDRIALSLLYKVCHKFCVR